MSYSNDKRRIQFNASNGATFIINDGTTDTKSSSLTLIGNNVANWMSALNQNMINMLINNASKTAPTNALTGQLWFQPIGAAGGACRLNLCTDSLSGTPVWSNVAIAYINPVAPKSAAVGNFWVNAASGNAYICKKDNPTTWSRLLDASDIAGNIVVITKDYTTDGSEDTILVSTDTSINISLDSIKLTKEFTISNIGTADINVTPYGMNTDILVQGFTQRYLLQYDSIQDIVSYTHLGLYPNMSGTNFVTAFNDRGGVVYPEAGDYDSSMIYEAGSTSPIGDTFSTNTFNCTTIGSATSYVASAFIDTQTSVNITTEALTANNIDTSNFVLGSLTVTEVTPETRFIIGDGTGNSLSFLWQNPGGNSARLLTLGDGPDTAGSYQRFGINVDAPTKFNNDASAVRLFAGNYDLTGKFKSGFNFINTVPPGNITYDSLLNFKSNPNNYSIVTDNDNYGLVFDRTGGTSRVKMYIGNVTYDLATMNDIKINSLASYVAPTSGQLQVVITFAPEETYKLSRVMRIITMDGNNKLEVICSQCTPSLHDVITEDTVYEFIYDDKNATWRKI